MSLEVAVNRWVTLRYRISDAQGEPVEAGERELTYLHGGYGAVLPRIEAALEGQIEGREVSLYLEPEDAFGDYDADLVHLASREHFPEDLQAGMGFQGLPGEPDDGRVYIATDLAEDTVVLDGNHPLAGMALRFEIRVIKVALATPEDIEREAHLADDDSSPD
jgi:FKBP-type peptidyl-prolyl cis-trans isomerase SlyD